MFNYLQYFWPVQDLQAVALLQNTSGAGDLILNGTYVEPPSPTISFLNQGFVRQVSLTSTNDLSTAVFTIAGVQNTTLVTTVINGPNNNTIVTPDYFDIVSSVSVDQAVSGVQVGTGLAGAFPLLKVTNGQTLNPFSSNNAFALGFNTESINGCTYQIYQSLTNLISNGQTYLTLIGNSSLIPIGSPYVNVTQILQSTDICYNILLQITSANNASTLETQFLQL